VNHAHFPDEVWRGPQAPIRQKYEIWVHYMLGESERVARLPDTGLKSVNEEVYGLLPEWSEVGHYAFIDGDSILVIRSPHSRGRWFSR
jgi:hypothetical protein